MSEFEQNDGNMKVMEIRALMDELDNQIEHLQRSQKELIDALDENPTDTDFIDALSENEVVIRRKREMLIDMKNELCRIDPAYKLVYSNEEIILNNTITPLLSIERINIINTENTSEVEIIISTISNTNNTDIPSDDEHPGLYL